MANLSLGKKKCFSCFLEISKNHKSINCLTCGGWFHARTSCVKSPLACQQTEVDICNMCLSCALPFYSIDDLELNFILGDFNRIPSDEDMDRLTQLKFNPFDTNYRISNCPNYESYMSENFDSLTCDYYLPNDFSSPSNHTNNNKYLSILNLNVRSIANKFDSFKNLLSSVVRGKTGRLSSVTVIKKQGNILKHFFHH